MRIADVFPGLLREFKPRAGRLQASCTKRGPGRRPADPPFGRFWGGHAFAFLVGQDDVPIPTREIHPNGMVDMHMERDPETGFIDVTYTRPAVHILRPVRAERRRLEAARG